jgi:hypothetical protein
VEAVNQRESAHPQPCSKNTILVALVSGVLGLLLIATPAIGAQAVVKAAPGPEPASAKLSIWSSVPFYAGADLAQYQLTLSQSRSQVRQQLMGELSDTLVKLASSGARAEAMLEPLADILLTFDQMQDLHKARDVQRVNVSLENQFKAALDQKFRQNDVREPARRIQFSAGPRPEALASYLEGGASQPRSANPMGSDPERSLRFAAELRRAIDFVAFGTFSNLGRGSFQLTLQLRRLVDGSIRSFVARGPLTDAVDELAQEVFDHFQKNVYPDWESPYGQLEWLPRASNPVRDNRALVKSGYTFQEANAYCTERGYRLPYARELMAASDGGAYKFGGVDHLLPNTAYPVLDRRHVQENYYLKPGTEHLTGGSIQPIAGFPDIATFWCVRGQPSPTVMFLELLWKLHRKNQSGDADNKAVFTAVETLRFELGDSDTEQTYFNNVAEQLMFEPVRRLHSVDKALQVLNQQGIFLEVPASMRRR